MAGGNRAFTLQDVLGQLNQDASGQSSQDDSALQINQLAVLSDGVAVSEAVTLATAGTSFSWNDSNAVWGSLPWGTSGFMADGGSAPAYSPANTWDGGTAASTYPDFASLNGGGANG